MLQPSQVWDFFDGVTQRLSGTAVQVTEKISGKKKLSNPLKNVSIGCLKRAITHFLWYFHRWQLVEEQITMCHTDGSLLRRLNCPNTLFLRWVHHLWTPIYSILNNTACPVVKHLSGVPLWGATIVVLPEWSFLNMRLGSVSLTAFDQWAF